jgi:fructose-1-phosphate kinase PfkB-like protein
VLDADADALVAGLSARPNIVKLNHHEAERLLGTALESDQALVESADAMREAGAETAVVTAGARGAVAISEEGAWRAWAPKTEIVSSVGAGDALLGAMLYKLEEGGSLEEGLRWGTAAGVAACLTSGTQLCRESELTRLLPEVRIEQIRQMPARATSS